MINPAKQDGVKMAWLVAHIRPNKTCLSASFSLAVCLTVFHHLPPPTRSALASVICMEVISISLASFGNNICFYLPLLFFPEIFPIRMLFSILPFSYNIGWIVTKYGALVG